MMVFVNSWKYLVIFLVLGVSGAVFGQDNGDSGEEMTPPVWATPAPPPPGFAPIPNDPNLGATPAPDGSDNFFFPSQPNDQGFDYFGDEEMYFGDDYGGGYPPSGGGSRSRGSEGKQNFRFVDPPAARNVCQKWGSSLLPGKVYRDRTSCEYELDLKVDADNDLIRTFKDRLERMKLKKVIRGEIENRKASEKYELRFDDLQGALDRASKEGCICLEN